MPVENDCEDQGYGSIAAGCTKLGCGRALILPSDGWWKCVKCGASYGAFIDHYWVEAEDPDQHGACLSCGHGAYWAICHKDASGDECQESTSYSDREQADDICEMMNTAFNMGRERIGREESRLAERIQQERDASRELARRNDLLVPALRDALEWAAPMAEAPPSNRPSWYDKAQAAFRSATDRSPPREGGQSCQK